MAAARAGLLEEVPDLVEYPSVVAGTFTPDFLDLPEEVLTTTMIHHQHYFPVTDEAGKLKPAFLAVTNVAAERPELIARNSERVLTALNSGAPPDIIEVQHGWVNGYARPTSSCHSTT